MPAMSLYVGVADKRLYGIVQHVWSDTPEMRRKIQRIEIQLAADLGHPEVYKRSTVGQVAWNALARVNGKR